MWQNLILPQTQRIHRWELSTSPINVDGLPAGGAPTSGPERRFQQVPSAELSCKRQTSRVHFDDRRKSEKIDVNEVFSKTPLPTNEKKTVKRSQSRVELSLSRCCSPLICFTKHRVERAELWILHEDIRDLRLTLQPGSLSSDCLLWCSEVKKSGKKHGGVFFFFFLTNLSSFEVLNDSEHAKLEFTRVGVQPLLTALSEAALIADDLRAGSSLLLSLALV